MKHEYTSDELLDILHDCGEDGELFECVVFLPREQLEAIIKRHFDRVEQEEERLFIQTRFTSNKKEVILSTNTHGPSRSSFRFPTPTEKATY